jgi:hypothetical protein
MKAPVCVLSCLAVLSFVCQVHGTPALHSAAPQPGWKVGDTWKIRTWDVKVHLGSKSGEIEVVGKGSPIDITFSVSRSLSTSDFETPYLWHGLDRAKYGNPTLPQDGYKCLEIRVSYPQEYKGYRRKLLLYFRQDTGNLIRILDIATKRDGSPMNMAWDFSPVPNGPITETTYPLLCDYPDFTQDPNYSRENVRGPGQDNKEIIRQLITSHTVKSEDGAEYEEYEVAMTTKRGKSEFKTVQKWRKGDPWWFEARQYENGKLKGNEAVLIRQTDGSK